MRARLGRDPFAEPFQQQIDGFVSRKAAKWTAEIVVRSNQAGRVGNRRLDSAAADCRELDEAVILTVTLIIDPNASLQPEPAPPAKSTPDQPKPAVPPEITQPVAAPPASSEPAPPSPVIAAPAPTLPDTALPAPDRETVIASRIMLAPSVAYGLLPNITPGMALRAELSLSNSFALETSAAFFPERRRVVGDTKVGYGLTALGTGGCYRPNRPVTLLACASGWIGVTHAVVYEGLPYRPGARLWAGLRTDLGLSATSDRLVAELRVFGMIPVTPWRFTGSDGTPLFEPLRVAPGAEIAVGLRLP